MFTILKALVAALVGLGIADYYYQKSLSDLHAEAEEQKNELKYLTMGIERVADIKYSRDASGRVVGVLIELKSSATSGVTAEGDVAVKQPNAEK
ncbi:MAG: hypothetical protein ABI167_07000 [Nitrosospira sp.]